MKEAPTGTRTCIVCEAEFAVTRSDKRVCSRKCGIKHQHTRAKEPTPRDRITEVMLRRICPEDYQLWDSNSGTHLFGDDVLNRTGAGDEWAQQWYEKLNWPEKLHPTSKAQSKKANIIAAAQQFVETEKVMTLRHLHYLLVSASITQNNLANYQYLSDVITEARERGDIPYRAIRDGVRNSVTFDTYESPAEFAESVAEAYRKDLWKTQRDAVEVWVEKDSVVSVVEDIAHEYCVTVRPMRGQASTSFLFEAAEQIANVDRNLYIYYFGDHDPSGYCIERSARERLIHLLLDEFEWTPGEAVSKLRWRRLGFLADDFYKGFPVNALDAKSTDSNYEAFVQEHGTEAAELEALPPHELRQRMTDAIRSHLNMDEWRRIKQVELAERDSWLSIVTASRGKD